MNGNEKLPRIDAQEFAAAETEAAKSENVYVLKLRRPFEYNGVMLTEIKVDFDQLTGEDGLAIENELLRVGKPVVAPAFSGEYLVRMAARVSEPKVGVDAFKLMSLSDYNRVRSAARSFLLSSEL